MTSVTELYGEGRFGDAEEAPVAEEPAPEAPSERTAPLSFADLEADSLVASLAGLAERVEQNQAARRAAEAELTELRAELERVAREREQETAAEAERRQELERERERRQTLRTKLIDLLRDFDD